MTRIELGDVSNGTLDTLGAAIAVENGDLVIKDSTDTTILQYDEANTQWEFKQNVDFGSNDIANVADLDNSTVSSATDYQSNDLNNIGAVSAEAVYNDEESSLDISEAWWQTFSQSWATTFYERFHSEDGFFIDASGSASTTLSFNRYEVSSGSTDDSAVRVNSGFRDPAVKGSWEKDRRMAVGCRPQDAQGPLYVVFGAVSPADKTTEHFGFRWAGGSLEGTVGDGTSETTVELDASPSTGGSVRLFAELESGTEARFWINKNPNTNNPDGTISSGLPSGTSASNQWRISVENAASGASDRQLDVSEIKMGQQP